MRGGIKNAMLARHRFGYTVEAIAREFRVTELEVREALGLPAPKNTQPRKYYAVVHCVTGKPVWIGRSFGAAMGRWEPGTSYGSGESKDLAVEDAQRYVRRYAPLVKQSEAEQLHREKVRTRSYAFLRGIYG